MLVEDGLVVPGTYSATCKSKTVIDVFKSDLELDKKNRNFEVGNIENRLLESGAF